MQAAMMVDPLKHVWSDASLTALLVTQCLVTFVAIPLSGTHPSGHALLELGHLVFAAVCAIALAQRRAVRAALLAGLLVLATGNALDNSFAGWISPGAMREAIAITAFAFNALVTLLVARRAFGPGRVTAHRIQGAVLVYLNVAALFSIAYALLEMHSPGAVRWASGGMLSSGPWSQVAELSYFSLSTITTTGYGDITPVHYLARSLANLEGVFGQLFPATFVARIVALHLAHESS